MHGADVYEPLLSSHDPAFDEFFGIYADSIPLRERKPKTVVAAMVGQPHYTFLLLKREGRIAGFSTIFCPPAEPFCLLEYMAIDARLRNSGLGRGLFLRSVQEVAASRGDIPMLLEVDSDRGLEGDLALTRRRQRFYERLGCRRVEGLAYVLPLPGDGPPPPMDLYVYFPDRPPVIRKSQLERWLGVVYESVYGCSARDARLSRMAATLPDPIALSPTWTAARMDAPAHG